MKTLKKIIYERKYGYMLGQGQRLFSTEPEPRETCWQCPKDIGQGRFQRIQIRRGIELWISDCTFHNQTEFSHREVPPILEFSYILSGHFHVQYDNQKKIEEYEGEQQKIFYFNTTHSTCTIIPEKPVKSVSLMVYPYFFDAYQYDKSSALPQSLVEVLHPEQISGAKCIDAISGQMRAIVDQIVNCQLTGFNRKLFLESKALEFLFLHLDRFTETNQISTSLCKLHPQDRKQTELIRKHLLSNMGTTPCLCELAHTAGMSHPKLNRCFKQAYGMTVFQYLRYERLNKAKKMLEEEGLSVTETAYQVGYDSLSHFSQVYKKHFGVLPSSSLKVA